jgi:hypothetical protein
VIVNSVCGRPVYDVTGSSAAITWPRDQISVTGDGMEDLTRDGMEDLTEEASSEL